jgi:tetratricopeptide (TPR) repeat protein
LLEEGDRALADSDLETAKESYDKASALAERDARVLVDLARLDAARADTDWLKVRLLPANQPDVVAAAKRQADQTAQRALKMANQALEVAPDDPKTARVKIDALRLSGDLAGARSLVARVGAIAAQPETAYVLAALDLAEESPNWPAVIDRLKTVAASESNPGRARGALVYALARSGDPHLAKEELDKMAAAPRPYALLAEERAFLARTAGRSANEVDAGRRESTLAPAPEARREGEAARAEGETSAANYRVLLQQASQAQASGNYDRAEQLYRAALVKSPNDTEALGGLGDIARARGNVSLARNYYERVLASNPHYLPALAALADIRWDSGDHPGAAKLYRDIIDTASEGQLAERAKARVAQVEASPKAAAPRPSPARSPSQAPSPSQPPSDTPPEIDTSDLPGFKR